MGEPGSSEEISSKMRVNALSGFSEPASQCNAPENAKVKLTVNFSFTINPDGVLILKKYRTTGQSGHL